MGRRLEIPVIDIFSKFFLHVVEGASPTQSDENERVVFKKLNHFAKFTFSSNVDLLLHIGFHAPRAYGSLTAEPNVLALI